MPFRQNIELIPNTPYGLMPTADWNTEAWENFRNRCGETDESQCTNYYFTDTINFQFRPRMTGVNLAATGAVDTGVVTNVTAFKCEVTGIGALATVGALIHNSNTGLTTIVTAIDSANVLSVQDDIFLIVGQSVNLYNYTTPLQGWNVTLDNTYGALFCRTTSASTNTLNLPNSITNGEGYYFSVYVRNYNGGELTVKFGTVTVGTISANGLHEFYGVSNGTGVTFESTGAQNFIGCFDISLFECYKLFLDYTIIVKNKQLNQIFLQNTSATSYSDGGLISGVCTIKTMPVNSVIFESCSCFYLEISETYPCTEDTLINGEFTTFTDWQSSNIGRVNRNAVSNTLEFKGALNGDFAEYISPTLCPILCETDFEIQFEVTAYTNGNLLFDLGGTVQGVNITGTGNYSFDVTTGSDCTEVFKVIASGNTQLEIDNLTVKYKEAQYNTLAISELLCVCEPKECDITLSYRNDVNSFGYSYEHNVNLRNYIHACGKLRNRRVQDDESIVFKDTLGTTSQVYSSINTVTEFVTGFIPPYLASAIHVALRHSDVLIDGKQYVCIDSFDQAVSEDTALQKLQALLVLKEQPYSYGYRR